MAFGILYGMRHTGVYKIVNVSNGKCYVGSSVQVESRIFKHLGFLRRGDHPNAHLQAAFLKYGEQAFDFELLEVCDKELLLKREQFYLDALVPEYNICKVAGNTLGYKHDGVAKAKMSIANAGNKRMLGKTHSEKAKQKMRDKAVLRKHTEATKAKIAKSAAGNKSNTGRSLCADHIAKVAASSLAMWNGDDKQARRLAASERAKARWSDPVWRDINAKKISAGKRAAKSARASQLI